MCTLALAMDSNLSIYLVKIRTYLKIRNAIPHMLADRHIAWSVLVIHISSKLRGGCRFSYLIVPLHYYVHMYF